MTGRDSTWDVRMGFDKIRWTDDEAEVRMCYPAAKGLSVGNSRGLVHSCYTRSSSNL